MESDGMEAGDLGMDTTVMSLSASLDSVVSGVSGLLATPAAGAAGVQTPATRRASKAAEALERREERAHIRSVHTAITNVQKVTKMLSPPVAKARGRVDAAEPVPVDRAHMSDKVCDLPPY